MSYKHGVYGAVADTYEATSVAQGTIPAYIGSAPIHRINTNGSSGFKYSDYVNKPILINSFREAKELGLYSENWAAYTLGEVLHAHFMNGESSAAPIILVNVLNPEADTADSATTKTVTMKKVGTKFIGYIEDPLCLIDNIALTIAETIASKHTVTYYYDGDKVVIEAEVTLASGKENTTNFTAEATYTQIAFTADKFTADVVDDALNCLDYCEQNIGLIPNIIAAPGISEIPTLHALMVQKAIDKLAGKWNVVVLSDIPSDTVTTYEAAETWKEENNYDSKLEKVFFPKLAYGDKVYHYATVAAYMMQNIDTQNSDVPYVSISNKELFCDRAVVGTGDTLQTLQISEQKANDLNKVGITTVNVIKRNLRVWGSHMGNYDHLNVGSIAPENRFDASVRMSMYILNYLQNQYINEIDESFSRKDVDSIVNGIQTWLDSLVNDNMLLYATVSFNNESNSDEAIANGDFVFDLQVTYSVIAKSITFKLQYTSAGLVALTTDGGEA